MTTPPPDATFTPAREVSNADYERAKERLRAILREVPARLAAMGAEEAAVTSAPGKWSPKQELGHLIDSACNNHQRIVRSQVDDRPAMPSYDGERWVALHGYQQRDWQELIALWHALNVHLLVAMEAASAEALARTCTIGDSGPLTLAFVFSDYVEHMVHHLEHIGMRVD